MPTDTPEVVESIKGTVFISSQCTVKHHGEKKGFCWAVQQPIDLDNAFRFLSSFNDLSEMEFWIEDRIFRFTDDWFKLFEALTLYRVTLHRRASATVEALISFLFGASSAPGSESRFLDSSFEWNDMNTVKAATEQLIEVSSGFVPRSRGRGVATKSN